MKTHLFGASGVGVTTLGEALSQQLGLPYLDTDTTDTYFWRPTEPPFTQGRLAAERDAQLTHDLTEPLSWLLSG
jgi:adenylate kinase family enzyme